MRASAIAAVLACALAASGCGGGKKAAPLRTVAQVKACFERLGARLDLLRIADFRREHVVVTKAGGGDFQAQLELPGSSDPLAVFVYRSAAQAKDAGERTAMLVNRFLAKDQSGFVFVARNVMGASFKTQPPGALSRVRRCAS